MQMRKLRKSTLIIWLLHWVSALLILYLLATSLTSGLGLTPRVSPTNWMNWHLSAGIVVLVTTMIRLSTSNPWKDLVCFSAIKKFEFGTIKSVLLLLVFAASITGVTIFQKSPLGKTGIVFGVFPMPTFMRLNHSVHNVVIDIHIAMSCIIFVFAVIHIYDGFRKAPVNGRSRIATMLWPWRN